jgi:short-subunit dehydrogenase
VNTKTVLITGASTGIGFELCKFFAQDKYKIVLTARNEARLRERAQSLADEYKVETDVIASDLSEHGAAEKLVADLQAKQITVDELVNNAGFGTHGRFVKTELRAQQQLLQLNIVALTELTKLLLQPMIDRKYGRILNVASTAAFVPGPGMAVYYASKAYVVSFSEALANELAGTGVSVTILCPGPTTTEFQTRAGMGESPLFKLAMSAERVAREGYAGMQRGDTMVIPGLSNYMMVRTSRLVPRKFLSNMVRKFNEPF